MKEQKKIKIYGVKLSNISNFILELQNLQQQYEYLKAGITKNLLKSDLQYWSVKS